MAIFKVIFRHIFPCSRTVEASLLLHSSCHQKMQCTDQSLFFLLPLSQRKYQCFKKKATESCTSFFSFMMKRQKKFFNEVYFRRHLCALHTTDRDNRSKKQTTDVGLSALSCKITKHVSKVPFVPFHNFWLSLFILQQNLRNFTAACLLKSRPFSIVWQFGSLAYFPFVAFF